LMGMPATGKAFQAVGVVIDRVVAGLRRQPKARLGRARRPARGLPFGEPLICATMAAVVRVDPGRRSVRRQGCSKVRRPRCDAPSRTVVAKVRRTLTINSRGSGGGR
jgi:hypothetical protein